MNHDTVEHDAKWRGRNHDHTIARPGQPLPGNSFTHSGHGCSEVIRSKGKPVDRVHPLTLRRPARSKLGFLFMVTSMNENMSILLCAFYILYTSTSGKLGQQCQWQLRNDMPHVSTTVMFIVTMNSDGHDEDSSRLALVVVKTHMSDRKRKTNEESKATRMMKVSITGPHKTIKSPQEPPLKSKVRNPKRLHIAVCGLFWVPYFIKAAVLRLL